MRKVLIAMLTAALLLLSACGGAPAAQDTEGPNVVVTIFPEYDWVTNIMGEVPGSVTLLMDSGVDLHSFQPSAGDIVKLASCDLFIYVGGESDAWAEDALKEAVNPNMIVLDLMELLGSAAVTEETVEGMEPEDEEDEAEYDEHVWLSLKNAGLFCEAIAEALSSLDPAHRDAYAANAAAYKARLDELDGAYQAAVESAGRDTLLFGDRFPFRYLTDDYGLRYYAAFRGCSAETEASFETVTFLAGKADELSLPVILTIEGSDGRIAQTIAENAAGDPAILTLDSMQSVTQAEAEAGTTYLSVMEQNLQVLTQALN